MSFKRDGDDFSQLNLLKKRRVADLLAEDIPEDEALLMRSGRYACTVCYHRPVFDTIAMLQVHRQGKKHVKNFDNYYAKKRNLMREVEKRKQLLELRFENDGGSLKEVEDVVPPLLTQTRKATHHALLKASPYNGFRTLGVTNKERVGSEQKVSEKQESFFQRLSKGCSHLQPPGPSGTDSERLPGNTNVKQSHPSSVSSVNDCQFSAGFQSENLSSVNKQSDESFILNICDESTGINVPGTLPNPKPATDQKHSLEKPLTLVEKRAPGTFELRPYVSKRERSKSEFLHKVTDSASRTPEPTLSISSQPQSLTIIQGNQPQHASQVTIFKQSTCSNGTQSLPSYLPKCKNDMKNDIHQATSAVVRKTVTSGFKTTKGARKEQASSVKPSDQWKLKKGERHREREVIDGVGNETDQDKYLKLTSSGWKSDWKGGWVQDAEVEFDSDEEPPQF